MCKSLNYVKAGPFEYFENHMLKECDVTHMWHYTSVSSFINIVKDKEIRFTDCLFLNDMDEYNYIFEVLEEYIKQKRLDYDFIKEYLYVFDKDNSEFLPTKLKSEHGFRFSNGRYYVLSGTSNPDSLPMWNYYSKDGKYEGYSIKIDIGKVFNNFLQYEQGIIYAAKVVYSLDEQLGIIEDMISAAHSSFNHQMKALKSEINDSEQLRDEHDRLVEELRNDILNFIGTCRLFFKNHQFEYESEIRIAILACTNEPNNLKFKPSFSSVNGVIKPSIGLSLEPDFPISSVVVSPIIDSELASKGVERLFESQNIKPPGDFKVEKSKINIRY